MRRHAAPPAPVTDEQLRLAWRHVNRPGWPATLEAALASPVHRICLLGIARNLGRRGIDRVPVPARAAEPELPLFPDHEGAA